ncbi:hypothetical protein [Flavobacterium sp. GSA192]|uniref:hypothetical protein n=1 Tax=Flavobacterium sp. GSA192 TaxID=2576304 RepID=UPI001127AF5D|nr:hypothetical protein [Flavobacterium sp. GSA192]
MNAKGKKSKIDKVEEPATAYEFSKGKQQGIDHATFDFDTEFANGYTPEEFKAEMKKRIRLWWGK